jgi:hypothetical protein
MNRVFICRRYAIDLDEYVEGLNETRSNNEQIPLSDTFLDEVYNQILELPDELFPDAITVEEISTIIEEVIKNKTRKQ